jgi:hypothetical protein
MLFGWVRVLIRLHSLIEGGIYVLFAANATHTKERIF